MKLTSGLINEIKRATKPGNFNGLMLIATPFVLVAFIVCVFWDVLQWFKNTFKQADK